MRLTRKLLVVAVLCATAILVIRGWNRSSPESPSQGTKPVMSPEETRRLVEQALGQPRETVRFRFEPSPAEDQEVPPLPPPSFAAANPPPPTLAPTNSSPSSFRPELTLSERNRENAVQKVHEAFARLSKSPKPLAPTAAGSPGSAAAAPAPPTPGQ